MDTVKEIILDLKLAIESFTNLIDQDIGVGIGEHSQAFIDTNDIVVGIYATLFRNNVVDLAHEQYYKANDFNYRDYNINYETFVLLHEIGHLQTVPTKKEYKQYLKAEKKINKSKVSDYEKSLAYWTLEIEQNADKWAMQYLMTNIGAVQELDFIIHALKNKLIKALN